MSPNNTLLIVDDDQDILIAGNLLLKRHFGKVISVDAPENIPAIMDKYSFDAILLDMNFGPGENCGSEGLHWLEQILQFDPEAIVIMITAHGDINLAVEAMRKGATDFILKPWQNEKIIATLSAAIKLKQTKTTAENLRKTNQTLSDFVNKSSNTEPILGNSPQIQQLLKLIQQIAPTDANAFLIGENGTGKELIAHEIHRLSNRSNEVFMRIDLGTINESLFESELFGHKKGAFTGANHDRIGLFEAADQGTLFLDEVGNLPLHLQSKLLSVLEKREVVPVGSNNVVPINVRIISATNMKRASLTDDAIFRQDLLFRLNTVEVIISPLRERSDDIPEIAKYYAKIYQKKYNKPKKIFSEAAIRAITSFHWPGNIRALKHAVERAVIMSEGTSYEYSDFSLPPETNTSNLTIDKPAQETVGLNSDIQLPLHNTCSSYSWHDGDENLNLEKMELRLIKKSLEKNNRNITSAAKDLGITRTALYRRIEKYGL